MDEKESEHTILNASLEQLIAWGFQVMITSHVKQGEPFISIEPGFDGNQVIVFHPCDYNYFARPKEWEIAHKLNIAWILERADLKFKQAEAQLGKMVDYLNQKEDPIRMVEFNGPVTVNEGPDGASYTFTEGEI